MEHLIEKTIERKKLYLTSGDTDDTCKTCYGIGTTCHKLTEKFREHQQKVDQSANCQLVTTAHIWIKHVNDMVMLMIILEKKSISDMD